MYQIEVTEHGETYRPRSLRGYADTEQAEEARRSFLLDSPWASAEVIEQDS
ncbi:hypothetical protein [Streptomyces sp. GbtcB6]|uniref:hypothetical protein n=1 Tax=Streptomyces sp. GbtcB6 TaxID=2824751 RepID=UPI001C2F6B25|nr:hypothetical protein [Streptomyces sp. GbtcB6]